ncbi:MAG: hypothetical protein OXG78_11490 [Chloroflexi bacterium]|nr:hypothetical protein [Chloroflexota bacterium]
MRALHLHAALGQTFNEALLHQQEQDQHRQQHDDRGGVGQAPIAREALLKGAQAGNLVGFSRLQPTQRTKAKGTGLGMLRRRRHVYWC